MGFFSSLLQTAAGGLLLASLVNAAPAHSTVVERQSTQKYVFAHFMMGIVGDRTSAADYDADMQGAKAIGVDAFALNIGTDSSQTTQLEYAYESAANNGMSLFLSFDFNAGWSTSDAAAVGAKIADFAGKDAQLKVDDKVFASTFVGDALDVAAVRSAAGVDIYFAPNFDPALGTDMTTLDGALNWVGWPNNGANRAPTASANISVADGDEKYLAALSDTQGYIAPVSPWFFTHFGQEVASSFDPKNWLFPGDLLWYQRWNEVLTLDARFLEIITWNDYGESHYIGPLSSKHYDDGNSKWTNDMPHNGWADMAAPFIAAYKAGSTDVAAHITSDKLVYWYRPAPKDVECDSTDNYGSKPDGYDTVADAVFVVTLLTAAAEVTITSGGNTQTVDAPAGAAAFQVPLGVGEQSFAVKRDGVAVAGLSGTSERDVVDECPCGIYNFNAYVGTLPTGTADALGADGLNSFTVGLHVSTCSPTPTLAARDVAAAVAAEATAA
ncbi:hypothetical protein BU16DRAFT_448990 [Neofusicoccum parvum]|uniref:Uncharacterized protein n=1 Tax=Neofusicoccum parvum TaxID=310453 RepID=A0ACB5S6M2_9PEZI|nr:hypothetical protein BU16DRAFT_448990 [Neofusicoccum parvum]